MDKPKLGVELAAGWEKSVMSQDGVSIECVLDVDNYLGETPVWSVAEQCLWWVNCEQPFAVHRWNPASGKHDVWPMPMRVGGLVLKAGGRVLVTLADGLYDFDPATAGLTPRVASPLPAHVKLHECGLDRQGRFWTGGYDHHFTPTNRSSADAAFLRLDGDRLTPAIPGISVANGLAFSPDGLTMYASDSPKDIVDAFDLNPATGAVSNRRPFLKVERGDAHIDGATVDAEGGYWFAAVGRSQLRRHRPDGTLDRTIELPFSNPTKLAFGGPDLDVIYVTSTKLPIVMPGATGTDRNGGLWAVRCGIRGLPEPVLREPALA
jgi:L-arabinonolactonase